MRLFISGDICPTPVTAAGFASGDVRALFGTAADLVREADLFFVNLECAITDRETPIRKFGPNLRAPVGTAATLRAFGVTAAGLSNNHTFDFGEGGLEDTKRFLSEAGILYTGVGKDEEDARKPLILEAEGKRIAFVAVCEHEYSYAGPARAGAWGFDPFETMEDIARIAPEADYTVVLYHGGKEQCEVPSPRLRRACRAMVRAGADLVLCQHSHCVGSRETWQGGQILYGQGNFNFVEHNDDPQWKRGLLLELCFGEGEPEIVFHPVVVTETGITLAEGEEKDAILRGLEERSLWLRDGRWLEEWHRFCEAHRESYTRAAAGTAGKREEEPPERQPRELFRHYLDCEAHRDVWQELFRTWHGEGSDEV